MFYRFARSQPLLVALLLVGFPGAARSQAVDPALTQILNDYASTVDDGVARNLCSLLPQLPSKDSQQAATDDRLGSYMKASAGFRAAAALFRGASGGEGTSVPR